MLIACAASNDTAAILQLTHNDSLAKNEDIIPALDANRDRQDTSNMRILNSARKVKMSANFLICISIVKDYDGGGQKKVSLYCSLLKNNLIILPDARITNNLNFEAHEIAAQEKC